MFNRFFQPLFNSTFGAILVTSVLIVGAVYLGMAGPEGLGIFGGGDDTSEISSYNPNPTPLPQEPVDIPINNQPYMGEEDAPIVLVEFVDFQCPYCKEFAETIVPPMIEKYIDTGKVKFVLKDFPLDGHLNAQPAAFAANCVLELGGRDDYFAYHDLLFKNQGEWDIESDADVYFEAYAQELGLSKSRFSTCFMAEDSKKDIQQDISDGHTVGVDGTPIFFVNGKAFQGVPPSFDEMDKILEAELQAM